ncbi:MAG: class 1 fructose-bisphosphatase [Phycisphaerales bacterium]|nr:class 1 fructose-bisphosphatase [Phycisphaerales bacterium]
MDTERSTSNLCSLQSHILAEETHHPGASGDFSWIVSAISLAGKAIAHQVRRARLEGVLGDQGATNVQGESQQRMDVIANEILMRCLGTRASIAVLASEEDDQPTILRRGVDGGKYCVLFDPLDGSSTLDTNGAVGTIFTILRNDPQIESAEGTVCQPGRRQVAAGYILYGPSTAFVITTGTGVDLFELDPFIGSFLLVKRGLRIPKARKVYSVNEAYTASFPCGYQSYLAWAHTNGYSSRYIGSLCADAHRILLNGGVFLYPPTITHPEGKLRLLYEANPMAMIFEQAGGKAISGSTPTMDINPRKLHQRVPLVLGSSDEVDAVLSHLAKDGSAH